MSHHRLDTEPMPFPEPGVRPRYAPHRSVRILHIGLHVTLEPAPRTFRGEARLQLKPYPGYAGRVELDLDEVEVTEVTNGDGQPLPFEHLDGQLVVRVAVCPAHVVVRWHGRDPRRGLYFTGPTENEPDRSRSAWTQCQDEDAHFVVPCHDHPAVKHPWTIEIEAPPGFTLLSNGERTAGGERDGRAWARFEQREPMPAYLLTMVAAPLALVGESWRGRPVRYLVPPGREAEVTRAFGRTPAMMEHLSTLLGVDYPWPRYDQVVVHDFVFGGMENVACTTMTDVLLVDERAKLEWDPDMLVVHELAHQWFGDLVTCQDWSQGWLNESWATYVEALWMEHVHPAEAVWYRHKTAQGYHEEASGRYQRPIVAYDFREPIDLFDRHLYNKGSCVLWTLRHELGDEAFFAGTRTYLQRHAHGTVHTRHFQRAIEEESGRNLDRFFAQWIHSPGHPVLEVKLGREGDTAVTVQVKQCQTGQGVPEVYALKLGLVLVHQDGRQVPVQLDVDERDRTWLVPVQGPVDTVRVDPGYRLLAEVKLKGPDAWLERLVNDPCPVLAVRAGKALLATGAARGRRAVEGAMRSHPFHGVRGALAGALGASASDDEIGTLVEALRVEKDPRVRRALAQALGRYRSGPAGKVAADALALLLAEDLPTWQLEGAAMVALGATRDPRARHLLEGRLRKESWADWVRQRALEGLGETEDPGVLQVLLGHTGTRHGERTRGAAAMAAARLADVHEPSRRPVVDRLIELLGDRSFRVQVAAVGALAKLRDPRSEAPLGRVHATAADGRTKRMAYEALVQVRKGRTTEEGMGGLRRRLDELSEENGRLRDRLDRLERP